MNISVRKAQDKDSAAVISYMKKLAEYEKLGDVCNITEEALIALLNEPNGLNAVLAECDGITAGCMTYYFYKIATFSGKRVMYIEDVYVDEEYRRMGIGKLFFDYAKETAEKCGCSRLEWKCLKWNTSAQNFYENIGGQTSSDEWLTYTIDI